MTNVDIRLGMLNPCSDRQRAPPASAGQGAWPALRRDRMVLGSFKSMDWTRSSALGSHSPELPLVSNRVKA